jgi:hypothetical protein
MNKNFKNMLIAGVCLLSFGLTTAQASSSRAPTGYSVIVAPANIVIMQIAFDFVDQNPCVLVSYEPDGNAADPFLHVWNSSRWVPLSYENYQAGTFIKRKPNQVIVLGPENALTEALLTSSRSWGPQSFNVPVTNARSIINGLGQRFNFTIDDWKWFAKRYELDLIEINAGERREIWYDQPNYFKGSSEGITPPRIRRDAPARSVPQTRVIDTPQNSIEVNPAVIRTTPTSGSSSIKTLPSIEQKAPGSTVITTGTITAQPKIIDNVVTDPVVTP